MKNNQKIIAVSLVAILCMCSAFAFVITGDDSDAATPNRTTSVTLAPGMRYTYTPTFPSDLNVTVSIDSQTNTSSPWGSVSNKTLTVTVPSNTSVSTYSVTLKYTSSNPTQIYYDQINFTISGNLTVSGSQSNIVEGTAVSMTPTASGLGTITWSVKSGTTLPAGLTLSSTSTGKVTGTPTATGTNTIKLTATTSYGETKDLTVTFQVYPAIGTISGDSSLYAKAGTSATTTAYTCANATGWSLDVSNAPAGATVTWDDTNHTITVSSASPQNSFTVILTATSSGGQQVTKSITVAVSPVLEPLNSPTNGAIAYVA